MRYKNFCFTFLIAVTFLMTNILKKYAKKSRLLNVVLYTFYNRYFKLKSFSEKSTH